MVYWTDLFVVKCKPLDVTFSPPSEIIFFRYYVYFTTRLMYNSQHYRFVASPLRHYVGCHSRICSGNNVSHICYTSPFHVNCFTPSVVCYNSSNYDLLSFFTPYLILSFQEMYQDLVITSISIAFIFDLYLSAILLGSDLYSKVLLTYIA